MGQDECLKKSETYLPFHNIPLKPLLSSSSMVISFGGRLSLTEAKPFHPVLVWRSVEMSSETKNFLARAACTCCSPISFTENFSVHLFCLRNSLFRLLFFRVAAVPELTCDKLVTAV